MNLPLRRPLLALLPFALVFIAWWAASRGAASSELLVPPRQVWASLIEMLRSGELQAHLAISLQRLALGVAIGSASGVLMGIAMAASPRFAALVAPAFGFVRHVPAIALIPALILVFGIGETFKVLIIVKASFFAMAVAASESVKGVSASYIEVAHAYRLPRRTLLWRILLPATLPDLLTGFRLAISRSWGMLVAAELLAAESGLGQMMEYGRQMFRMDVVMVGLVLTGLIGYALDRVAKLAERRLTRWRGASSKA